MTSTDKWDWLAFGLLVGFTAGYVLAFFVDYLDRKAKSGEREHTRTNQ